MIKSAKELAIKLSNGGSVEASTISVKLAKKIFLWLSRKEIEIIGNMIVGRF